MLPADPKDYYMSDPSLTLGQVADAYKGKVNCSPGTINRRAAKEEWSQNRKASGAVPISVYTPPPGTSTNIKDRLKIVKEEGAPDPPVDRFKLPSLSEIRRQGAANTMIFMNECMAAFREEKEALQEEASKGRGKAKRVPIRNLAMYGSFYYQSLTILRQQLGYPMDLPPDIENGAHGPSAFLAALMASVPAVFAEDLGNG